MHIHKRHTRKGVTLVEVIVALVIAGFVSLSFMGAVIYSIKATDSNKAHFLAMQTANVFTGRLAASNFGVLGHLDMDANSFEAPFKAREANPLTIYADPVNESHSLEMKIWFEFTGWGTISSGTVDSLTATFPAGVSSWKPNEWQGHLVTIILPSGLAHVMRIKSNTSNSMNLTADLSGEDDVPLANAIEEDGVFIIDNAKTARMFIEWGDGQDYRRIVRQVVVRRLNDDKNL